VSRGQLVPRRRQLEWQQLECLAFQNAEEFRCLGDSWYRVIGKFRMASR